MARPEEALESVLLSARHDVNVQMRNALAYAIVDGYERAFGFHPEFDGARQKLRILKERTGQLWRQVCQRLEVLSRNQQAVAREQRPVIEEGQREMVFKYRQRRDAPRNNLAE